MPVVSSPSEAAFVVGIEVLSGIVLLPALQCRAFNALSDKISDFRIKQFNCLVNKMKKTIGFCRGSHWGVVGGRKPCANDNEHRARF